MTRKLWQHRRTRKSATDSVIVCIASGPSLTKADCATIETAGLPTVAVNTSWQAARFARWIYAGDPAWWEAHHRSIDIPAERWTCNHMAAKRLKLKHHRGRLGKYNSGMRAIQFAIDRGARTIILLGYDCSLAHGIHWHGEHTRTGNPRASSITRWHQHFGWVATEARRKGIRILNCSRHTALRCFETMTLEAALESIGRGVDVGRQSSLQAAVRECARVDVQTAPEPAT